MEENNINPKIKEIEEKIKLNRLEKQLKREEGTNYQKIITPIISVGVFFLSLFLISGYFQANGLESNLSSLYGVISGIITSFLALISIGKIKEFSVKGGSLELSAKLNEEISFIKGEVKESKKEIEGVNRQLQQIQNLVITSIQNKIHIGDVVHAAKEKEEKTSQTLSSLGISVTEPPSKIEIPKFTKDEIDSTINEEIVFNKIVKDITGISPENKVSKILRANYFYSTNQFKKSIQIYDELLKNNPTDYVILNNKGLAQIDAGDFQEGIKTLEQAEKIHPNDAVLNNIGLGYGYIGNISKAKEYFNKSLRLLPSSTQSRTNLAAMHIMDGEFDESAKLIDEVLVTDPKHRNGLMWKASLLIEKNDYPTALEYAKKSINQDPNNLSSRSAYGLCLILNGNEDEGFDILNQIIDDDATGIHGHFSIAAGYAFLKDKKKALLHLKTAIANTPSTKIRTKHSKLFESIKTDLEFKQLIE